MNTLNWILLIIAHLITGLGIMGWLRIKQNPFVHLPMATILGLVLHSLMPALLDMMHIKLTTQSVGWSIVLCTLIAATGLLRGWRDVAESMREWKINFKIYELPALLTLAYIFYIAAWRCWFFPVTPRDMLSGPEAMAELALKEGTVFNSFFTIDLATTNNHLKSPFMTGIQIIYKMFVQHFGQVWLTVVVLSFATIVYTWLKQYVHGLFAGLLMLLFVATPESFAYTFMILFDYTNMVLLAIGAHFLFTYLQDGQKKHFWMAAIFMGFATYVRTETLILVAFFTPLFLWDWKQKKYPVKKMMLDGVGLVAVSFLFYFLVMNVYIKGFIPAKYDVSQNINPNLTDLSLFFKKFGDMNSQLLFGEYAVNLWNYFMYFFILMLLLELIIYRRLNKDGRFWLYAVMVVYVGLPFIGYLLPLADVVNTTKRGLFKILPFMLLYMRHHPLLLSGSKALWAWERDANTTDKSKMPAKAQPITASSKPHGQGKRKR